MGKFKFTLSHIFLWMGVILSALIMENVGFLTPSNTNSLPDQYFFVIASFALVSYFSLFICESIHSKRKHDYYLIAILGVFLVFLFISNITFNQITFSNSNTLISETIVISTTEKAKYIFSAFLFICTLYTLLRVFPTMYVSPRRYCFIYIIVIVICYFVSIYSLATEQAIYDEILNGEHITRYIQSVFWNVNMFAGTLLMGIAASIMLNVFKKNVLSYVSIAFFFIISLFTASVLAIAIELVLIFAYLLFETIYRIRYDLVAGIIWTSIYVIAISTAITIYFVSLNDTMGHLSKLFIFLHNEIQNCDYSSFSHRTEIWDGIIQILKMDPIRFLFGYGHYLAPRIINSYVRVVMNESGATLSSAHSGYVQILFNYGIIGLLIYGSLTIYFFYSGIKLLKKTTKFSIITMFVGLMLFAYSVGESVFLFNCNVQGLLVGVCFYLPLMMRKQIETRSSLIEEYEVYERIDNKENIRHILSKTFVTIIILAVFTILSLLFVKGVFDDEILSIALVVSLIDLVLILIFAPFATHLIGDIKNKISRILISSLGTLITIIFYIGLCLLSLTYIDTKWILYLLLPLLMVIICIPIVIAYHLFKQGDGMDIKKVFLSMYLHPLVYGVVTFIITLVISLIMQSQMDIYPLMYVLLTAISIIIYTVIYSLFKTNETKKVLDFYSYLNGKSIAHAIKKQREKEALWRNELR